MCTGVGELQKLHIWRPLIKANAFIHRFGIHPASAGSAPVCTWCPQDLCLFVSLSCEPSNQRLRLEASGNTSAEAQAFRELLAIRLPDRLLHMSLLGFGIRSRLFASSFCDGGRFG